MDVIEHDGWTIAVCWHCGGTKGGGLAECDCECKHDPGGAVLRRVVPAEQLAGAVSALERIVHVYSDAPDVPASDLADIAGEWLDHRPGGR